MTQGLSTDDIAGRTTPEPERQRQPLSAQDAAATYPDDAPYPTEGGQRVDAAPPADLTQLPLLDDDEADTFLARWSEVQARFVDDPQGAVRDGDGLVAELMQALARRFSERKGDLEEQWNRGGEPETEELRLALQQYRSFFQRLLAT